MRKAVATVNCKWFIWNTFRVMKSTAKTCRAKHLQRKENAREVEGQPSKVSQNYLKACQGIFLKKWFPQQLPETKHSCQELNESNKRWKYARYFCLIVSEWGSILRHGQALTSKWRIMKKCSGWIMWPAQPRHKDKILYSIFVKCTSPWFSKNSL